MMYLNFTRLLDIHKEILRSGAFELSDKTYEFTFSVPKEARYNVVLRFLRENENDTNTKYRAAHTINAELRDINNDLVISNSVDQNSRIHEGWSRKEFDRYFLSFNAKKKQTFRLKIDFHSNDEFLNKISKEIYVEKDFDPASYPWWGLFQRVFLIVVGVTLLLIVGLILLMVKKKRNLSDCSM